MAFLKALVALCLVAAPACHASRADAQRYAREWMRMHDDPDQQGMDELKATNPEAYAIVNALLTKRSLGMLNLKHPSARFDPKADQDQQQEGPTAVDVLRAASAPQPESSVEMPVAAVSVSAHTSSHNWLNWKPHDDDDAMVKNVLGAVADIKSGGASAAPVSEDAAPPAQEEAPAPQEQAPAHRLGALSFDWGNTHAESASTQRAAAPPAAQAPQNQDPMDAYMSHIGGGFRGSSSPAQPKPILPEGNALQGFSWDSSDSESDSKANTGYIQQQGQDTQSASKTSSFGALGSYLR